MSVIRAIIVKGIYIIAMLCALGGLAVLFGGLQNGNAVQQSGVFTFGIGLAVVPYCVARAVEKIFWTKR